MDASHQAVSVEGIRISSIRFRNADEYADLLRVRSEAFTPWYEDIRAARHTTLARLRLNALAETFPEFFLEARSNSGEVAAWLFCLPARWNGDVMNLGTFDGRSKARIGRIAGWSLLASRCIANALPFASYLHRFLARRIRNNLLAGADTILLGAMLIRPEFRGRHIPALLLRTVAAHASTLNFHRVIGPFRPADYGAHKTAKRIGFDPEDFASYCATRRADGQPVDSWLRALVRNGARVLKPEARSYTVTKSLRTFEQFRQTFKPGDWYEAAPGQWECGETQSWFINGGEVSSVEPNIWCEIPLP